MKKIPLSRKELAIAYSVSVRTLYTWLQDLGIDSKYVKLSIPDCERLFDRHGKPSGVWE
jgi:hypothetical protein